MSVLELPFSNYIEPNLINNIISMARTHTVFPNFASFRIDSGTKKAFNHFFIMLYQLLNLSPLCSGVRLFEADHRQPDGLQ